MKRLKVLVVAAVFAVMTIGAANSFAQLILEEPILVDLTRGTNASDDEDAFANRAPAAATPAPEGTPEPTPEPTRRPTGGGGGFVVIVLPAL